MKEKGLIPLPFVIQRMSRICFLIVAGAFFFIEEIADKVTYELNGRRIHIFF